MPSVSRADGVATPPAAARAASKRWQFVNVKVPKKNQDREIISLVRAHAMRNVRRKQRLQLTAQHQKRLIADASGSDRANSVVIDEHPLQMNPSDWSLGDKVDIDRPLAVREIHRELEAINLADRASRNKAEVAAENGEDAQRSEYRQRDSEDETQIPKHFVLGKYQNRSPRSPLGDGAFDPFNVMPIAGCTKYTSQVLNHCT